MDTSKLTPAGVFRAELTLKFSGCILDFEKECHCRDCSRAQLQDQQANLPRHQKYAS
jgi:hypothetical protein